MKNEVFYISVHTFTQEGVLNYELGCGSVGGEGCPPVNSYLFPNCTRIALINTTQGDSLVIKCLHIEDKRAALNHPTVLPLQYSERYTR